MDGKRPAATGGLQPVDARATGRARSPRVPQSPRSDSAPDPIANPPWQLFAEYGADGRYRSSNADWRQALGYDERELEAILLTETLHPDAPQSFLRFLDQKESQTLQVVPFLARDGQTRTFRIQAQFSKDSLSIAARDLTIDPANALPGLQVALAELGSTAIALLDTSRPAGQFALANLAFETTTGFRQSDLQSLRVTQLFGEDSDAGQTDTIVSAIDNGHLYEAEIILYRRNGDQFWASVSIVPIRDPNGHTPYTALSIEDISSQKEAQKIAIQQENLRSLGQMASGIAHDFNNLLAPILGFSELLLNMPSEGRDDRKLVTFLEKIKVAAQDGAAVVGRLREFYSSQDQDHGTLSDVDLETLATQVSDLTQHRWKTQAEARGVQIKYISKIRSRRRIHGNEPELRQALSNLVINSADAIESDGTITLAITDQDENVKIQISDTGKGMPEEIRSQCLNPFYTTKGNLGTGLGLSIVTGVVKRHGGEIEVDSEEGVGTTITITLPAVEASSENVEEPLPAASAPSDALRILLVDDEAVLLEVTSELLGSGGHDVDKFESAEAALDAFRKSSYDLVITDRAMPNMSGEQLASAIKAINPETPVIMATGFGETADDSGNAKSPVDLVLAKPVPLDLLNKKLLELTSRKLN